MATAFTQQDLDSLAKAMEKAFKNAVGASSSHYGPSIRQQRTSRDDSYESKVKEAQTNALELGEAQKRLAEVTEKMASLTEKELKNNQQLSDDYSRAVSDVSNLISSSAEEYRDAILYSGKNIHEQAKAVKKMNAANSDFTSDIAKAQKNASLFAAALIASHNEIEEGSREHERYISNLKSASSKLDKGLLQKQNLLDEKTGAIKSFVNPEHFAKLRANIGAQQSLFTETLSGIGIDNFKNFVENQGALSSRLSAPASEGNQSRDAFTNALIALAEVMKKQGYQLDTELNGVNTDFEKLAHELANIQDSANKTATQLDSLGADANRLLKSNKTFQSAQDKLVDKVIKSVVELSNTYVILRNFGQAYDHLKRVYADIKNFNVAGIGQSYLETQVQGFELGLSKPELMQYLQENKSLMASYGKDGFNNLSLAVKSIANANGYTMDQVSMSVKEMTDMAINQGITVTNQKDLANSIDGTIKSFGSLRGIIGTNLDGFVKLQSSLLSSSESQQTLLGLDKKQAGIYVDTINSQIKYLAMRGIETGQIQEIVKANEAAARQPFLTRMKESAFLQLGAQTFGMSAESSRRLAELSQLGQSRTTDQTQEFNKLQTEFAKSRGKYLAEAYSPGKSNVANQFLLENIDSRMGASLQAALNFTKVALNDKAGISKGIEANRAQIVESAKPSETVARFAQLMDSASAVLENDFIQAIKHASLALLGVSNQSLTIAKTLATVGGTAVGTGLGASAALGGTAAGAGWAAKMGGANFKAAGAKSLGALAVGTVGDYAGDKFIESGHEKAGGWTKAAATAGSWALTGAALGSVVPILGNGVGAAIGGTLGGAYGLYSNWDNIAGKKPVPEITQQAINDNTYNLGQVIDSGANAKLTDINTNLIAAVGLLQQLVDFQSNKTAVGTPMAKIPSTAAYSMGTR